MTNPDTPRATPGEGATTPTEERETIADIPGATPLTVADWQELLTDAAKHLDEFFEVGPDQTTASSKDIRCLAAALPSLLVAR